MTVTAHHVASSTGPCGLGARLTLSPYVVAEEGYCVAVRALDEKPVYNQLERTDGTFATIHAGDVLVGALGERLALKGYSGRVPRRIAVGDVLHILNMGGIVGRCASDHPELGPALRVEVLGAVMVERGGMTCHARISDGALEPVFSLSEAPPLVMVSGTAMNTGKTYAAARLVEGLTARGKRVAAAKLTGAALMRDVRVMREAGAVATATFNDAGLVSSTNKPVAPVAKALIRHLAAQTPDAIVLELGDGIIGPYGVDELLGDRELQRHTRAHVVAAVDLAGAWAADQLFRTRYHTAITAFTGPVTDNAVGTDYLRNGFGVPAFNALQDAAGLVGAVEAALGEGLRAAEGWR